MKAMILAAGLGTRLRPLTDNRPKALVQIAGRTLLEIALARMRRFGIRDVIINIHHFADMIQEYLERNQNFGMSLAISREESLLDTGGGLKRAAHFLEDSLDREEPFLMHNVDVVSAIDLRCMVEFHAENKALATLAVQNRKTSRYLLFDETSALCGRESGADGQQELARSAKELSPLAFCGIHVISPRFLARMSEEGAFSIISSYLRLAAQSQKIAGFRADGSYWRDLGTPADLAQAAEDFRRGAFSL